MTLITNYYPNPMFAVGGARHNLTGGKADLDYQSSVQHLWIGSTSDEGGQAALNLTMPAGPAVFYAMVFTASEAVMRNGCAVTIGYTDSAGKWVTVASIGQPQAGKTVSVVGSFTAPGRQFSILFNSPGKNGDSITFDNPMLLTKSDWDWWQENKPATRFNGDLMPLS